MDFVLELLMANWREHPRDYGRDALMVLWLEYHLAGYLGQWKALKMANHLGPWMVQLRGDQMVPLMVFQMDWLLALAKVSWKAMWRDWQ